MLLALLSSLWTALNPRATLYPLQDRSHPIELVAAAPPGPYRLGRNAFAHVTAHLGP
ncbi:hypothetical protein FVEN_g12730 [Fusarium venenatum]|nr:hypothetical protein FVEN_g12730 [Fusarium venenatum]